MFLSETIAAISTPLGNGGLAVIRLSGPAACQIAELVFEPLGKDSRPPSQARTHTIHYGRIVRATEAIDEVLLAVMRAPKSFTREDVVEISSHGGILPAKLILDLLLEKGARLAEPGEFTKRAFLNGRIDLAQAEAVVDIIHSRTELALAAANEQLAGKLSRRINQLRDELMITLAHVEAHIDFPDEDIAPATRDQLLAQLGRALVFMDDLLKTADEGKILRHGIYAAIVGRPNVGKSSLLNQLLGRDRAIVSPVAGTTRDTIEETANIRGVPVVFVDTAGIRESMDQVEVEGIRRTQASLKKAELILQVCDISEPWTSADQKLLDDFVHKKQIVVFNKSDLPHAPKPSPKLAPPAVEVSCFTGAGIEPLKGAIKALVWSGEVGSGVVPVMINSRHQDALRRGSEATKKAEEGLISELTLELVALDLRIAVSAIGEIVGKTSTEDLLDSIFSQFCIGK